MDKTSTNSQLGQKSDRIKSLDTNLDFYNSKAKVNASFYPLGELRQSPSVGYG
ncbi:MULTISPECIES: hypothetical protein [Limnospira]|uniref:hypothetical protein n=1 Tax=Limnospira TaxID=2596745 RepID=UPI0012DD4A78|nr:MULTISPECIES: hypothetical protein [Limnospira]QJB24940.1 hypothetical protein HFV01_02865 [Limnospira fusiformis SAG 85.79]QNH56913.1 MAG: hypothetical protein H2674_22565 [Limnospira indica BM01]